MSDMPDKIYVQDYEWSPDDYSETTWCVDKQNDSDTQYTRTALVDELIEWCNEWSEGAEWSEVDAIIAKIKGDKS